ncbi:MAG TPA: radical SAM protein [Candidatus Latescibacteria bacterium]|nr:radical SAM protein [Candidatus Latescibacterota bacterium]
MGSAEERYIRLREDCFLAKGARNCALYDMKAGRVYQVRGLVQDILKLGIRGLTTEAIISRLGLRPEEGERCLQFLQVMSEGGLLRFSPVKLDQTLPVKGSAAGLQFMWLELTSYCNLRCIHCYAGAEDRQQSDGLSTGEWKDLIREGAALGCRRLQFTGGEATLRDDLFELVECARTENYEFIEIFSNLTTLNRTTARQITEAGAHVATSIYSYRAKTHDLITRKTGSFYRTVQGIRLLLKHKVPVRVAIIVLKQNEEDVDRTIRFVEDLGVEPPMIGTDVVRPTGRGRDKTLLPERYSSTRCPDFCVGDLSQNRCWPGKITVTSQGEVIPCIFARNLVVGKYRQGRLSPIVNGEELQKLWRITLDEVEVCRDCEYRYACWDCRAIAYTATGNLYAKSPRCTYDPYTGRWIDESEGGEEISAMGIEHPDKPLKRGDLVFRELEGEGILFDPKTGSMHSLTKTALLIWNLCDGRHSLKQIADHILERFEAEPDQVRGDVKETVGRFQQLGLLQGSVATSAEPERQKGT